MRPPLRKHVDELETTALQLSILDSAVSWVAMIHHEFCIHLVARNSEPLQSILSQALKSGGRILHWQCIPTVKLMKAGDTVVIDLLEESPSADALSVRRLPKFVTILLVTGGSRIDPDWIQVALQSNVRLIRSRHESLHELITGVEHHLRPISGAEIAQIVMEREPLLKGLDVLVRTICEHPWDVRHPKELALASGLRLPYMRGICQARGFERVEHFIVAVRMIALEWLIGPKRVPIGTARTLVGISDATNARRQFKRARLGSPTALDRLGARIR